MGVGGHVVEAGVAVDIGRPAHRGHAAREAVERQPGEGRVVALVVVLGVGHLVELAAADPDERAVRPPVAAEDPRRGVDVGHRPGPRHRARPVDDRHLHPQRLDRHGHPDGRQQRRGPGTRRADHRARLHRPVARLQPDHAPARRADAGDRHALAQPRPAVERRVHHPARRRDRVDVPRLRLVGAHRDVVEAGERLQPPPLLRRQHLGPGRPARSSPPSRSARTGHSRSRRRRPRPSA